MEELSPEALKQRLAEVEARSAELAARLQQLINDSEARFSALFRDAAVGILLIDTLGCIAMANAAAARILGVTQEELRGARAGTVGGQRDVEEERLFDDLVHGRRLKYRHERRYLSKGGAVVWVSTTASLIRSSHGDPEYALALLEDISERKEVELSSQRLRQEEAARVEAEAARRRIAFLAEASVALSSSLDWSVTLDKLAGLAVPILGDFCLVDVRESDGTMRRVTEAAVDPGEEEILRTIPRIARRRQGAGAMLEVMRSGKSRLIASMDGRPLSEAEDPAGFRRIGGEVRPSAVLIVPLVAGARTLGTIVFGTTQKERAYSDSDVGMAEEFAHRAALAIDNARLYQEAKEASRLKDDFLAVVSHELRTPLMPILGWSRLLLDGKVNAQSLQSGLSTIERNARAQARLVDDLLDVSRIIAGKLKLETRTLAFGPAIEDALESMRPAAKAKQITLSRLLDPSAPRVVGDPTRIQQIVWNLVANAIKFTPAGGRVEVRVQGTAGRAVLTVTDTGEGIRADFLPFLFERFRQGEAATTRKHGGLGLGLSIVRHLVELHGGTVAASSPGPGQGAVFTVTLPAATAEAPALPDLAEVEPEPSREQPLSPPPRRLDRVRLVLVDNQPDTLDYLRHLLGSLGAEVLTASSAAEALALVAQSPPDVLVSDIGLPGEDGHHLIRKVRELDASAGGATPAVALTAFARAEDRVRALTAGYQSHVPKPVDPAELAAVIASLAPLKAIPSRRKSDERPKAGSTKKEGAQSPPKKRPRKTPRSS